MPDPRSRTAYVPLDTSAVAADAVAAALECAGVTVVRNGSRGMAWAEPLVEVVADDVRICYRNVGAGDVPALLREGAAHVGCLWEVHEIDHLRGQMRVIFDRAGEGAPLRSPKTTVLDQCLGRDPQALIAEIETSGLRGRGGAGFPVHI